MAMMLQKIFDTHPLSIAELWCLLQLAALPAGNYDVDTLIKYFVAENAHAETDFPSDIMIEDCKSSQVLAQNYPFWEENLNNSLSETLKSLSTKGWLTEQDDDYTIHALVIELLQQKGLNDLNYLTEILNCLRINYFTEQHSALKETLLYEKHLLQFTHFIDEQPTPQYLDLLEKLISLYNNSGYYQRELDIRLAYHELVKETNNEEMIANALTNLAENYNRLFFLDKALEYAKEALTKAEKTFYPSHSLVIKCQTNLAKVYQDLGKYSFATNLFETVLANVLENYGSDHLSIIISQSNLGYHYSYLGKYDKAVELLETALTNILKDFDIENRDVSICQANLGNVYKELGKYDLAAPLLERALANNLKNFGVNHPNVGLGQNSLAWVYKKAGRDKEAKALWQASYQNYLKNFGEEHPKTVLVKGYSEM
jgi:tetratricopeptide (TPR) repeat protein